MFGFSGGFFDARLDNDLLLSLPSSSAFDGERFVRRLGMSKDGVTVRDSIGREGYRNLLPPYLLYQQNHIPASTEVIPS